ncbi:unnamed protein product [Ostreobium quekettii]|uniref:NTF2 domain-containing protein n=1 Tax=Ostreobium quekettii TaxID=121088 RepID=A0A8S1IZ91_9CHLO|nr:unnamed protein product [Ostreobium quekettii]
MGSHAPAGQGPGVRVSKDTVAKRFIDMYFGILNTSRQLLYRFYRTDSTVMVSESLEDGSTLSESADTEEAVQELVKTIFADVTIKVETSVAQFSMEGSVLILVSGTITKSNQTDQIQHMDDGIQRMFSQAFLLAPQENGYYVLTDSMQIRGHSSNPILKKKAAEVPFVCSLGLLSSMRPYQNFPAD